MKLTICGITINAPNKYQAGDIITAEQASMLNTDYRRQLTKLISKYWTLYSSLTPEEIQFKINIYEPLDFELEINLAESGTLSQSIDVLKKELKRRHEVLDLIFNCFDGI